MTDYEGNRKIYLLEGFRRAWKLLTIAPGEADDNIQLFSGTTESRDPGGFFCWLRNQSLFVLLYHYMPPVYKIAIHNKLTKTLKDAFQFKIYFKYM